MELAQPETPAAASSSVLATPLKRKASYTDQITVSFVQALVSGLGDCSSDLTVSELDVVGVSCVQVQSRRAVQATVAHTPVPLSRLVVKPNLEFSFEVLFGGHVETGVCRSPTLQDLVPYLNRMLSHQQSGFTYCPGVVDYETRFGAKIRFQPTKLRRWSHPFVRTDAAGCKVLFKVGRSTPMEQRVCETLLCQQCKRFEKELNSLKDTAEARTEDQRKQRTSPSSNIPVKFLSPKSHTARLGNTRVERRQLKRDLAKYEHLSLFLSTLSRLHLRSIAWTLPRQ